MLKYINESDCDVLEKHIKDGRSQPCSSFACVDKPGGGKECECSSLAVSTEFNSYSDCKDCLKNCTGDIDTKDKNDDEYIKQAKKEKERKKLLLKRKHKRLRYIAMGLTGIVLGLGLLYLLIKFIVSYFAKKEQQSNFYYRFAGYEDY